ncbi:MAG: carboxypeptidase-like regulatory domain-containing protein [Alicyclobacillus sp.]|nr:carboxypeptidase-like regulatory domain-containing protein [Alicyclobacillus sp.]
MSHLNWDEVWALVDGLSLPPARQAHAAACPWCADRLREAEACHEALTTALSAPLPPLDDSALQRLTGALRAALPAGPVQPAVRAAGGGAGTTGRPPAPETLPSSAGHSDLRRLGRLPWRWAAGAAAVAALAAGVGGYAWRSGNGLGQPGQTVAVVPAPHPDTGSPGGQPAAVAHPADAAQAPASGASTTAQAPGTASRTGTSPTASTATATAGGASSDRAAAAANAEPGGVVGAAGTAGAAGAERSNADRVQTTAPALAAPDGSVAATAVVRVRSLNGDPIGGANVWFVSGGRVVASAATQDNGSTPPLQLVVAPDAVLAPLFNQLPALGDAVLVVAKNGYQPVVVYENQIRDGAPLTATVTLTAVADATAPVQVSPPAASLPAYRQAYLDWALQQPVTAEATDHTSGSLKLYVTDDRGLPLAGAHVRVFSGQVLTGAASTDSSGWTPALSAAGVVDTRLAAGNATQAQRVVAVVVEKAGYVPAVGLYQPVSNGAVRVVSVGLSPLARGASANQPAVIPGEHSPGLQDALSVWAWVELRNGNS